MSSENSFFLDATSSVRRKRLDVLTMPTYGPTRLSLEEANSLPWNEFRERMCPTASLTSSDGTTEFLFVPKNVNWTVDDLSIFAGTPGDDGEQKICNLADFTPRAGRDLWAMHFNLSQRLIEQGHAKVQSTLGFNPLDLSPGHHSLIRFHTHLRSIGNELDLKQIRSEPWKKGAWFEKLTTIEPFAVVYFDLFKHLLEEKGLFSTLDPGDLRLRDGGFVSFDLARPENMEGFSADLSKLYDELETHYTVAESVFTNREEDPETGRYVPLSPDERRVRFATFLEANSGILSEDSIGLMSYLVENLRRAERRPTPNSISKAAHVHATKGFAGGFSFTVSSGSGRMALDFFPRIITTTGPTKNLFAGDRCVGFEKVKDEASPESKQACQEFLAQVKTIIEEPDILR